MGPRDFDVSPNVDRVVKLSASYNKLKNIERPKTQRLFSRDGYGMANGVII